MPLTPVPPSGPSVFVVILNWNGWKDTIACIDSLKQSSYRHVEIVIVDNGSTDNSIDHISAVHPEISLIQTNENLGFARGNNRGIKFAMDNGAELVFVLNNDTNVASTCIDELVQFANSHSQVALMGPRILNPLSRKPYNYPMKKRIGFLAILFTKSPLERLVKSTSLYRKYLYLDDEPRKVYAISGSAMMFRAEALKSVGLFDETTFLYWEEFIMAERLHKKELDTFVVPTAHVWHSGDASTSRIGARKFIENIRSERYFFRQFLRMSLLARYTIKAVRIVGYCARAVVQQDYRKNLFSFFQDIIK